jgi:hypothetical protein
MRFDGILSIALGFKLDRIVGAAKRQRRGRSILIDPSLATKALTVHIDAKSIEQAELDP